ncbi:hypothetical protein UQW22_08000 [Isoptericola halotolerans]
MGDVPEGAGDDATGALEYDDDGEAAAMRLRSTDADGDLTEAPRRTA